MLVHLSGELRGRSRWLRGERLVIGTGPEADVRVLAHEEDVGVQHAVLERQDDRYRLHVTPGRSVWVNGEAVETRTLESGDLLEIGSEGPVLRFRLMAPGSGPYKSPREAFADSLDTAAYAAPTVLGRTGAFLAAVPRELATQTTVRFRVTVVFLLLLLMAGMTFLTLRSVRLEKQLTRDRSRFGALAEAVEGTQLSDLTVAEVERLRRDFEERLADTTHRLDTLEARSDAPSRIISMASGSVVFLQGSYAFRDPISGRPLRFLGLDDQGRPLLDDQGEPLVTEEGEGPVLERLFTGTAFAIEGPGRLVTNRHVGRPWEEDEVARDAVRQGVRPFLRRLLGYLPEVREPFELEVVATSQESDLSILRGRGLDASLEPLSLREEPPRQGEEVLVLGYPAGMQALLARSEGGLVREILQHREELDFWSLARRLSEEGQIAPLATRGIVGQVTTSAVVYDAQTTFGGSGGPVLDLEGRVVAVNSAILASFAGSNLGVPAARVRRLLEGLAGAGQAPEEPPSEAPPGPP